MSFMKFGLTGVVCIVLFVSPAFGQTPRKRKATVKQTTTPVSDTEISGGLKEALAKGVRFAVDNLGRENGFWEDVRVRIPLPKNLQKVKKSLAFCASGQIG